MAYTPSVSELDSHQGDARLAIGGGGSMAGNLPLTELFGAETMNQLSRLTDDYVSKKNKQYDQWQQNIAKAYEVGANATDLYSGDLPQIQSKKKEFYDLVAKNQNLMTPDAPIKNPKKWQEFKDKENELLTLIAKSKQNYILDREYRKSLQDPKFRNDVNEKIYNTWRSQPIEERTPLLFIQNPDIELGKIKANLSPYKEYGTATVTPIGEGRTQVVNNWTIDQDSLYSNLIAHSDLLSARWDMVLTDEEKNGKTKEEWIKEQLLSGVKTSGSDKPTVTQDIIEQRAYNAQRYADKFDTQYEQRQREQQAKTEADKAKRLQELADVETAIIRADEVFEISNGKKVKLPSFVGDVYEVTEEAQKDPQFKGLVEDENVYIRIRKNGEQEIYKIPKSKLSNLSKIDWEDYKTSKETLIVEALGRDGNKRLIEYNELANGSNAGFGLTVVSEEDGQEKPKQTKKWTGKFDSKGNMIYK